MSWCQAGNRERVLLLRCLFTFWSLTPILSLNAPLHAMVVVPAEFSDMVAASQTIVHGRVIDVQSYETAGRRTIESLVTVQVVETIKGQPGGTAYFKLPGGQVVKASSLNASRVTTDPLTWQDPAWISFDPDAGIVLTS